MAGGGEMNLLRQAKLMQDRITSLQNDLKQRVEEGSAGGGVVKAYVNGLREVMGVKIAPEVIDPDDRETLEELIAAAFKNALEKAKELEAREMAKISGGLNLPGLF
jgi:DNA-binding YbaB/EbfC family protein